MSYWIHNRLHFIGNANEIERLKRFIKGRANVEIDFNRITKRPKIFDSLDRSYASWRKYKAKIHGKYKNVHNPYKYRLIKVEKRYIRYLRFYARVRDRYKFRYWFDDEIPVDQYWEGDNYLCFDTNHYEPIRVVEALAKRFPKVDILWDMTFLDDSINHYREYKGGVLRHYECYTCENDEEAS